MKTDLDVRTYNRDAWNGEVGRGNKWTLPVSPEVIAAARRGDWSVVLTPTKPVPREWFGDLKGKDVLGLASAGGQQCPVFAAAGANVTVFDLSSAQLGQDRKVAEREGLAMKFVEGDMRDLSAFADASFDLIFHPCSNCFAPEILPVWREAFRVLRPGGVLLSGICDPVRYLFDPVEEEKGVMRLKYTMPYSDFTSLTDEERRRYSDKNEPMCVGHSLEDQLGGQMAAGFVLTHLFEDKYEGNSDLLSTFMATFMATRALKPVSRS
ncbi:class I SAM-dependent methyltransferase [Corallococcus sp. AB049A]|uniref:class I SAM-dependent methyltransferase n=1 Tax=Corallococcus sp. AB049A TaxID=2316721 RepID=UPI000EA1EEC9|nr:class I SAM-dependent methyltransferase [Corallococcus sp. AB049A]RKH46181.1 class I SAM-dependent methyltransferase [Corallococcus sp. AB050B]RKI56283.1 class I SAM-dependent methyltransferase [Corallococcus sp. AB049A]